MAEYPLIVTLTFEIRCSKVSARVVTHGRALMALENGEWWCHGVDPGGLTANGENPAVAFSAYKQAFQDILYDLASDSGGFDRFDRSVREFVGDTDRNESERWQKARDEIRSGSKVEEPFSGLERVTETVVPTMDVAPLKQVLAGQEEVSLAQALPKAA